ncbi:helix-turn-helix transcriptional regulator [Paraburkholderia aspalathi]|nr:helix-turn-helix transcriptional regulator [Paraburkholderia sp. SECH2]MDQ6392862.1 helix-turn-helix transcriptional regulator [Paraburkholderia aspalathi]
MKPAELARLCGVSAPTVSNWESGGIKTLEAGNMLKICEVLDVDPWWLVLGPPNGKAPITEDKSPLSNEAFRLVSWIERVDALGDPARKLFSYIYAALQVAGTLTQAQNSPRDADADAAEAAALVTSHIAHTEGKERANKKHKP